MTFLALARGVAVNAAAVVGGIYDLQGLMEPTKQRMPGVANQVMKLIPDYSSRGAPRWPNDPSCNGRRSSPFRC
jgi:hypothetical protein